MSTKNKIEINAATKLWKFQAVLKHLERKVLPLLPNQKQGVLQASLH